MAFVCWLALLAPGGAPPAGMRMFDDRTLAYPLDVLTTEGGGGYDGWQNFEEQFPLPPPPSCFDSFPIGNKGQYRECMSRRHSAPVSMSVVPWLEWAGLPSSDPRALRKRVRSILDSDRIERHKREEIALLIKPGMGRREVCYLIGARTANALVLIDVTLCFDLDLVIEHPGGGAVTQVRQNTRNLRETPRGFQCCGFSVY